MILAFYVREIVEGSEDLENTGMMGSRTVVYVLLGCLLSCAFAFLYLTICVMSRGIGF